MFFFSGLLLFTLIMLLVHFFHSFNWNNSINSIDNVWMSPFECGFLSFSSPYSSFTYGFISFLVLFVLFDLEMSLFLNFCFSIKFYKNFMVYYVFLVMLCLGFSFEVLSGTMKWSM